MTAAYLLDRSPTGELLPSELLALMERPAWWARAACRHHPLDLFFPRDLRSIAPALAVCARCPVKPECLAMALAADPPLKGIFGGTSENERRRMRARG